MSSPPDGDPWHAVRSKTRPLVSRPPRSSGEESTAWGGCSSGEVADDRALHAAPRPPPGVEHGRGSPRDPGRRRESLRGPTGRRATAEGGRGAARSLRSALEGLPSRVGLRGFSPTLQLVEGKDRVRSANETRRLEASRSSVSPGASPVTPRGSRGEEEHPVPLGLRGSPRRERQPDAGGAREKPGSFTQAPLARASAARRGSPRFHIPARGIERPTDPRASRVGERCSRWLVEAVEDVARRRRRRGTEARHARPLRRHRARRRASPRARASSTHDSTPRRARRGRARKRSRHPRSTRRARRQAVASRPGRPGNAEPSSTADPARSHATAPSSSARALSGSTPCGAGDGEAARWRRNP